MKTLRQANLVPGTKALVRCDLDVPLNPSGELLETFRLDACIPTLDFLIQKQSFPIIIGHMGRPEGIYKEELSTKHLLPYFEKVLGKANFELVENLRFDPREEENNPEFARELAQKADLYVNESFATCHRSAASITGVAAILPAYAGLRLEQEINVLSKVMASPQRPFVAIIGGVKIASKKPVIARFLQVCDAVLVGGKIGLDWTDPVPENLLLPVDYVDEHMDIGVLTIQNFKKALEGAKSVVWSGPLGYCEGGFDKGTKELARVITESDCYSVVGGGDTIAILKKLGFLDKFDFVSTGGGAMLQLLADGTLPGIEALN